MIEVPKVSPTFYAFPTHIEYLPAWEKIPEEFKGWPIRNNYVKAVSTWFYEGLGISKLKERPGVDRNEALMALGALLRSFEPKHEHKIAGAAYLMSEWFEDPGED